jgi:PAS domain S-box-containing protein
MEHNASMVSRVLPLMGLFTIAVFIADLRSPRGNAIWVLYMIPLWLTLRLPSLRAPITMAIISSTLIVVDYVFSHGSPSTFALTNRILGLIAVWIVAVLLIRYKRVEDRVRESEARFRQMADTVQEVFWMATPDGQTTTYVSPAYEKVWGRSPAELFADPTAWLEGIHPEDRSRVLATLEQYKKKEAEVEYRVIRPDGSVRWLWDHRYPVSDLQGQLTSVVGFAMDITERKQTEDALRESDARFSKLVSSNILGIIVADLAGRVLEANDAFLGMLGFSREDLESGTIRWDHLTPPEWAQVTEQARNDLLTQGAAKPLEKEYFHKNRSRVPVMVGIALVEPGRGICVCFVLNLTERKRSEAQRERLVRQLQEALSNIKTLKGLLHICTSCQRVRDPKGLWKELETYVRDHSEADFRQDLCPACGEALFPGFYRPREKYH